MGGVAMATATWLTPQMMTSCHKSPPRVPRGWTEPHGDPREGPGHSQNSLSRGARWCCTLLIKPCSLHRGVHAPPTLHAPLPWVSSPCGVGGTGTDVVAGPPGCSQPAGPLLHRRGQVRPQGQPHSPTSCDVTVASHDPRHKSLKVN